MEFGDVAVGELLEASDTAVVFLGLEQMGETLLRLQILGNRHPIADLAAAGDHAMFGLEYREQPGLDGESGEPDRIVRRRAPSERARHVDMNIAGAINSHGFRHLTLQVVEVGYRRSRNVGNAMRHRDFRHALAGAKHVSWFRASHWR